MTSATPTTGTHRTVPSTPLGTASGESAGVRHSAILAERDAARQAQETPPESPQEPHARRRGPGRNLPAAIIVGLLLVGVLVGSLYVLPVALPFVVGIAIFLGVLEVTRALAYGGLRVPAMPVLVGSVGMVFSTVEYGVDGLIVAAAVAICVLIIWRVTESMGLPALRDVCAGAFTIAWLPFLGCFVLLLHDMPQGAHLVLLAILIPVANDTGGFILGALFGTHPMAPSISPKKSWEGFVGSLIGGVACAIAIVVLALGESWWVGLILGVALVIISTCGDLAESLLKRDLGIKDMGHLLPGHGGVLDRVDSILLAAPSTYILLEILLP